VFNRSLDGVRFIVRVTDIMGSVPPQGVLAGPAWAQVQHLAFGATFAEYAERFLTPMVLLSSGWNHSTPPLVYPAAWTSTDRGLTEQYRQWFAQASVPLDEARAVLGSAALPSGLSRLPPAFFRTPFIRFDDKLVGLSPWHVRDHAVLGTWAKLNAACKTVLKTNSSQTFSSAFGLMFEGWCARLAQEACSDGTIRDALFTPARSGGQDEIEDVVFHDGEVVALLSAKASLVPEASLKAADRHEDGIMWLRRFFFEEPSSAMSRGHRGGAAYLLDKKVEHLRAGAYESRGISRNATVLPAVLCFDNVGESGILYRWLEEECLRREILNARPGVSTLTVVTPEDYEALLALGRERGGICRLLVEKTQPATKWGPLDHFIHERIDNSVRLRLPTIER